VVEQFDNLILMREGYIIYNGPRSSVLDFLHEIGVKAPPDQDVADFLTAFLTDPEGIFARQQRRELRRKKKQALVRLISVMHHQCVADCHERVPCSIEAK